MIVLQSYILIIIDNKFCYLLFKSYFRHQISHYTQQLSKDTSHNLKELNELRSYSSQTDQVCNIHQFRLKCSE